MRPTQRNLITAAVEQLARRGHVRVQDPTVRATLHELAELGLLRLPYTPRTPKTRPAVGATRRLQALSAEGWTQQALAEALSASLDIVKRHRRGDTLARIGIALDDSIRQLYEAEVNPELSEELQAQATAHADRSGWAHRWQWRNLDIDDAGVQPHSTVVG